MDGLTFTGERLVPSVPGFQGLFREHVARYFVAARDVGGRVLDAGTGCGYGAYHLASNGASEVVGIDSSTEAIAYAQRTFPHPAIDFQVGDLTSIDLPTGSFDAITCFEVLEHLHAPGRFLDRCNDWLATGGVLWLSTPNVANYRAGTADGVNPFHVHEYTEDELRSLLEEYFGHVELYGQFPLEAELVAPEQAEGSTRTVGLADLASPSESLWGQPREAPLSPSRAAYLLARCSREPRAEPATGVVLSLSCQDLQQEPSRTRYHHELQRAWDEVERRGLWALDLRAQLEAEERRTWEAELEAAERTAWAQAMERELKALRPSLPRPAPADFPALGPRDPALESRVRELDRQLQVTQAELRACRRELESSLRTGAESTQQLAAIRQATFWRISAPLRRLLDAFRRSGRR